ncbi:MAG: transcriptional repressor LexA [Candidatus Omnitrophica bacterium]|nr:transcriptional repressor LexA [Candidatus Omnitrophota bacterium]
MPKRIDYRPIVKKLKTFYSRSKRLPSFSELQSLLGYQSKGGVSGLVENLIRQGIVARDSVGKLIPTRILKPGLKIFGTIQAGFPSPAEEELLDTVSLDEYLIQKPESSFLVKVTGDSMIEAGIHPGDLVIVDRGRDPKSGDIVIAQVDGQWTMKYFEKREGKVILRAANKKYPTLTPKEELVIGGVVVANVRKYQ